MISRLSSLRSLCSLCVLCLLVCLALCLGAPAAPAATSGQVARDAGRADTAGTSGQVARDAARAAQAAQATAQASDEAKAAGQAAGYAPGGAGYETYVAAYQAAIANGFDQSTAAFMATGAVARAGLQESNSSSSVQDNSVKEERLKNRNSPEALMAHQDAVAAGYSPKGVGYAAYIDAYLVAYSTTYTTYIQQGTSEATARAMIAAQAAKEADEAEKAAEAAEKADQAERAEAARKKAAQAAAMTAAEKELLALACASAGGSSIAACAGALSADMDVLFGDLHHTDMAESLREGQSAGKRADVQGRLASLGGGGAGIYGFSVDLSKSSSNISGGYMVGDFNGGTGSYNLHSGTGQLSGVNFGISNFQGEVTSGGVPVPGPINASLNGGVGRTIHGDYAISYTTPTMPVPVDQGSISSGNITIRP